jgi:hypothetical protein
LLSNRTVGRETILSTLDQRLLDAATSASRAHTLLIGPRGSGKTHLLNVAIYRAQQRPVVVERLAFVRFDEDAVGISRYDDLLHEVLVKLGPSRPAGRRLIKTDQPERAVREALNGRVLVLVIENLDRVFQALGLSGQQNFRAWVETTDQVMVLATAPLLFHGVRDRAMPWWGNFGISHLDELDLDQGRELLIRLARESDDLQLVDYLGTGEGLASLRAINEVAGGSPRIWTILSECLTVERLDELVPAVEALLEGLVPYYQQLLWDLSPVEQRLVRVLADGPHQAATVAELADAADVSQRVAATTLGRLADIRWVRPEKAPQLDQRSTWYRLQEPMVRHHFHYRSAADQPLPLIVEILKAWYSPTERRSQLALAASGSTVERFAAASLGSELITFDSAYLDRDVDKLRVEARTWVYGAAADTRTAEAGILIDLAVTAAQQGTETARETLATRGQLDGAMAATGIIERATEQGHTGPAADRVGELLRIAADQAAGRTQVVLELVSACWDGPLAPAEARDRLRSACSAVAEGDPLRLELEQECAYWTGAAGDAVAAGEQLTALVPVCERVLGAEHPATLTARNNLAYWTGEAGDAVAARQQFAALVPVRERVLGAEHPATLTARNNLAYWTGEAGDAVAARDRLTALVPVCERVLGVEDPRTLAARNNLAHWTGEAGDPAGACELAGQLLADSTGLELPRYQRAATAAVLTRNLRRALAMPPGSTDQPGDIGDIADLGLVGLLQAAVNGSAEALVRLPSELVPIVESLRAQRVGQPAAATPT